MEFFKQILPKREDFKIIKASKQIHYADYLMDNMFYVWQKSTFPKAKGWLFIGYYWSKQEAEDVIEECCSPGSINAFPSILTSFKV